MDSGISFDRILPFYILLNQIFYSTTLITTNIPNILLPCKKGLQCSGQARNRPNNQLWIGCLECCLLSFSLIMIIMEKQLQRQPPLTYEAFIKNHRHRLQLRSVNFDRNSQPLENRPKTAQIKAIQKFIVKLKGQIKNQEAVLSQMDTLNLSKYVQQISASIANVVSEQEISFYAKVATRLNNEYEDFPRIMLKDINKQFTTALDCSEDNKQKLKSLLLFTTELFVCGFTFPYKEISEMLKKMVKAGTKKKNNFTTEKELRLFAYFYNCDTYCSFLINFGTIFTQATPKWVSQWKQQGKQVPKYPQMIPTKVKQDITNTFFTNYVVSCISVLQTAFSKLKELEDELRQNLRMTGQFNKQIQATYDDLKEKFIFTKKHLLVIIEAISHNAVVRNHEEELVEVGDIMKKYINKTENAQVFDNQFERELYLQLPMDLCKTENKGAGEQEYKQFKERLDKCKNKSQSDQIVKLFQEINNKRTRKMLAKDILEYRKEYQLVTPFLCRIATLVAINYRDIQEMTIDSLFAQYQKLRENINSNFVVNDKRSRNLKYICELTKFKMVDNERAILCIQNLIEDLKGYNIELLIAALQSIGRYLYLSSVSANKFTFLLSKLQNVLKQKSFPLFTTSQLLNSISLLKPHPDPPKKEEVELAPIQKQAERIAQMDVIDDLDAMIEQIENLIKKKDGKQAIQASLVKQIQKYDFLRSYNYTFLISELDVPEITEYTIGKTVQKLQQATRLGNYQSCLLWSRFLGELFKYNLIKRSFLMQTLRKFINLSNVNEISIINLVCTVLESCQEYLHSKKAAPRNQTFLMLVEFKKFISKCSYVPMLEEFKIIDVFEELQPNLISIKSQILDNFLQEHKDKMASKEFDLGYALDDYLQTKNLKEAKPQIEKETKDIRLIKQQPQKNESNGDKNSQLSVAESKTFQGQFLTVMNSHIKDLSGKIAKPAFVEKVIERKKDKRKVNEGEKKITVIARNGNKFAKKDIVYTSQGESTIKN